MVASEESKMLTSVSFFAVSLLLYSLVLVQSRVLLSALLRPLNGTDVGSRVSVQESAPFGPLLVVLDCLRLGVLVIVAHFCVVWSRDERHEFFALRIAELARDILVSLSRLRVRIS